METEPLLYVDLLVRNWLLQAEVQQTRHDVELVLVVGSHVGTQGDVGRHLLEPGMFLNSSDPLVDSEA